MAGREKRLVGKVGEEIAFDFLRRHGYRLISINHRTPLGEIDAVARIKDLLVFIEVKTRTSNSFGPPYLAVTRLKQLHIIRNAYAYLKRYGLTEVHWRIDVVSVLLNSELRLDNIEIITDAVSEER